MNRPTTALVFGILNIVFFVLGLCGTIIPLSVVFVQQNPNAPSNPLIDLMQSSDAFKAFTVISAGLGLVGAIVLCFAGIGLLMMRNWGVYCRSITPFTAS